MTSNPDSSRNNEDADTDSESPNLWLADNYPKYLGIRGLPSDYLKFTVDSPTIVGAMTDDLYEMSELRATACYDSVINKIEDHMDETPEFEALVFAPDQATPKDEEESHLISFLIGHSLDEQMLQPESGGRLPTDSQLIIDADVAGIIESPSGTTDEELVWMNPDLLQYDYLTLCQALDGVIYSETATGALTSEHFVMHIVSDLSLRRDLLTDDPSFYESIYTPTVEYLLNEHYDVHY
jgi:hypothetical protein